MYWLTAYSNVDDSINISSDLHSILFLGKGTLHSTILHEPSAYVSFYEDIFSLPDTDPNSYPIFFVSLLNELSLYIKYIKFIDSEWRISVLYSLFSGGSHQDIDVYCFKSSKYFSPPSGNYGMALYNSDSELTYHTGWDNKILSVKLVDSLSVNSGIKYMTDPISKPAAMFTCNAAKLYSPQDYLYKYAYLYGLWYDSAGLRYRFSPVIIDEYYDGDLSEYSSEYQFSDVHQVAMISGSDYD